MKKALLDTNIIIHREASKVIDQSIGTLFKWLDRTKLTKCIHPITVQELNKNLDKVTRGTFNAKIQSYEILRTVASLKPEVQSISSEKDKNENDKNDTILLNEVFSDRVDILISEDRKIHEKAKLLGVEDRVFKIDSFLEMAVAEYPELIDYKVLAVKQEYFGNIDIKDTFFDSLRSDYPGFNKWFNKKSEEKAYITYNKGRILSFLFLKLEDKHENYSDINPAFAHKKRLKVGTFKVVSNGVRLGERFMKIIFDNALRNKVDEIYVTIFNKTNEQQRLINLMEEWGFKFFGAKGSSGELVYVRDFSKKFDLKNPKKTFPFISTDTSIFLVPIYPEYHTDLLPDSFLKTESPEDFVENEPHRNALSKVYISRSKEKNINRGDIIVFYRTGGYYKSVLTTIGTVEEIILDIKNDTEFINLCRKRSVFSDKELTAHWNYYPNLKPFIVKFLHNYSFSHRINMQRMIELGIIKDKDSAPRGFQKITKEQFLTILKETKTNDSFIIN
ncbi:MAG: hypothetical protein FWG57_05300 [Endomicrobia bacterium]|nr:hypothetical protein [Endomicrobiia bacterium]